MTGRSTVTARRRRRMVRLRLGMATGEWLQWSQQLDMAIKVGIFGYYMHPDDIGELVGQLKSMSRDQHRVRRLWENSA